MQSIIEVKNLYISFGGKKVLKGVSFSLEQGECLGLIGGSGEGKSTLLRSIIGLEYPSSGKILFEGGYITNLSEEEYISIRKKISYVFQGGALFDSMTVYENLAFSLREHTGYSETKIREIVLYELKEFELEGCENMYPIELSGGMQKRVGIARATISKPKVILYDEPTSGLDPYKKRNMQNTIMKLQKRGTTSMMVTHDMSTALRVCDRVALLSGGKIKAIDTPKNFKESHNVLLNNFVKGIKQGENHESA
jgi:phospholipid/cholesterol/gamma-HCH transport system ATP-binding protein